MKLNNNYKYSFLGLTLVGLLGMSVTVVGANAGEVGSLPTVLKLEEALELSLELSQEMAAARTRLEMVKKEGDAVGLWKNPDLKFEAENIGGDRDSFSEGEYTIGLKQEFQLGGKRKKQRAVAIKSVEIYDQELSEIKRKLFFLTRKAFLEIVYLQETGKIQMEQEELGRAFVEVAKRRHKAGGGSELEVVQAELELETVLFSQTCCLGELIAAKQNLIALIGFTVETLPELTAPYYELAPLKEITLDNSHPTLQRLIATSEKAEAEALLAKAQDVSNISLGAGYKYEAEDDSDSFVITAAIPLGFNKRGRIEHEAGLLRSDAALRERDATYRRFQAELAAEGAMYAGSKAQAEMGRDVLIPKAEKAYVLSQEGYESGRFSWLELIAAQQRLAGIRMSYIEALRDAHLARIKILKINNEENE